MKLTLKVERERFDTANRHIAATEDRIEMQRRRIAKLRSKGARCDESENLLIALLDVLSVMQRYRQQVLVHLMEMMSSQEPTLRNTFLSEVSILRNEAVSFVSDRR